MFQIVYTSKAVVTFSTEDLEILLARAREKNSTAGVTGMLVYSACRFLQVFEGDAAAVIATFDHIEKDHRHGDFRLLHRGHATHPQAFDGWSMGFRHLNQTREPAPGHVSINDRIDLSWFDYVTAIDFLLACRGRVAAKRP